MIITELLKQRKQLKARYEKVPTLGQKASILNQLYLVNYQIRQGIKLVKDA